MISLFAGGEIENPRFKSPLSGDPGMQVESLEERSLFSGGFTAAVKMQHVEQPTQVYEFPLHLSVPQSTAKASVDTAPKSMDPGKSLHVELTPSDDNGVLTGIYTPLALVMCMPVSFCVFYWDTPLEGWGSRASTFGEAVLICNTLLCLAYFKSYRSMFALRSKPRTIGAAAPSATQPAGA